MCVCVCVCVCVPHKMRLTYLKYESWGCMGTQLLESLASYLDQNFSLPGETFGLTKEEGYIWSSKKFNSVCHAPCDLWEG